MGKGYEKKYKVTRILLIDYLLLKEFSQSAGISMAEALHDIITREEPKTPVPVAVATKPAVRVTAPSIARVTAPSIARVTAPGRAQISLNPILKARSMSTNVQLRATVAKGGSSNGAKQV